MIKCEVRLFESSLFRLENSDDPIATRVFGRSDYQRLYLHPTGRKLDFHTSDDGLHLLGSLILTEKIESNYDETRK